jgi:hypothetical protein
MATRGSFGVAPALAAAVSSDGRRLAEYRRPRR